MKNESETKSKISPSSSQRVWKRLMFLCSLLCWGTVGLVLFQVVGQCSGFAPPKWFTGLTAVLLAALVGFFTNYLAIKMLFQPYIKTRKHYISLLTLGLWQQGLVPAKKNEIAAELGEQIENRLLDPEKIADELCQFISELIDNHDSLAKVETMARAVLSEHESQIVDFFYPFAVETLNNALDDLTTADRSSQFVEEVVIPWLQSDPMRQMVVDAMTRFGRQRTSQISDMIRSEARKHIRGFLARNPLTMIFADQITDPLVNSFPWHDIEWKLYEKINSTELQNILKEEILKFINDFRTRLKTQEIQTQLGSLASSINKSLKDWLTDYLRTFLPHIVSSVIYSDGLWAWVRDSFLPSAKPKIQEWVRINGKKTVIEKLRIAQRVRQAVDRQDIKEFHDMVNSLSAQHLGAIQVLGWILGGIIGLVQLLIAH